MRLSEAIPQFKQAKQAERCSPRTLADYGLTLRRFRKFFQPEDPDVSKITPRQIRDFLNTFAHLKAKTVLNYWVGLASMWTWLTEDEIVDVHVVRKVRPPKPEKTLIVPYTEKEIRRMLGSPGREDTRNKAILLTLLDTGIRASELCDLRVADLKGNQLRVQHGKGAKERWVPVSRRTLEAIRDYLYDRPHERLSDPLFEKEHGGFMNRHSLRLVLYRWGKRLKIEKVGAHRFRHTFAINFIRNGGGAYELQAILGHSTLDMTKRYVNLATMDLENSHREASPVKNWGL